MVSRGAVLVDLASRCNRMSPKEPANSNVVPPCVGKVTDISARKKLDFESSVENSVNILDLSYCAPPSDLNEHILPKSSSSSPSLPTSLITPLSTKTIIPQSEKVISNETSPTNLTPPLSGSISSPNFSYTPSLPTSLPTPVSTHTIPQSEKVILNETSPTNLTPPLSSSISSPNFSYTPSLPTSLLTPVSTHTIPQSEKVILNETSPTNLTPPLSGSISSPIFSSTPSLPTCPPRSLSNHSINSISSPSSSCNRSSHYDLLIPKSSHSVAKTTTSYLSTCLNSVWLKTLLSKSQRGRLVLHFYKDNNLLTDKKQKDLTSIIIENELEDDPSKVISVEKFKTIAKAIVACFPQSEIEETYYIAASNGKVAKGKLYDKFRNVRRQLVKDKTIPSRKYVKASEDASGNDDDTSVTDAFRSSLLWLKSHLKSDPEFNQHFITTVHHRLQPFKKKSADINAYFQLYPALHVDARDLIDKDFTQVYPERANALFTKWIDLESRIAAALRWSVDRREGFQTLLHSLEIDYSNEDPEAVTANCLWYLTAVLPSVPVKGKWKPAKKELKDNFILIGNSSDVIKEKFNIRKEKLLSLGICPPAVPVIIGDTSAAQYYVFVNNVFHWCPSLLKAVDLCYKIYTLLNKPLPEDCALPWNYIQRHIYGDMQCNQFPTVETLARFIMKN